MKIDVFYLRVICTCDQCDSPFCALQLTALIKPDWCFLLYCCACLYHSLEVVQPSWIAVPCPTTKLSLLISKSFVRIKQGVIRVALKTLLKNKVGNLYLQNFTSASARWPCWFYIKLSPPTFYNKIAPMILTLIIFGELSFTTVRTQFCGWRECINERGVASVWHASEVGMDPGCRSWLRQDSAFCFRTRIRTRSEKIFWKIVSRFWDFLGSASNIFWIRTRLGPVSNIFWINDIKRFHIGITWKIA